MFKVNEGLKYKVESPFLNHALEIFQIKYQEFFSCVSRFHLPCVRGYYNGDNVYLLPSCVSAHMTFVNMDYKYFAGSKDPIEIINKYRTRGFGTILNDTEKIHLVEYSSSINSWKNLYDLNIKNQDSVNNVFGNKGYSSDCINLECIIWMNIMIQFIAENQYNQINMNNYVNNENDYQAELTRLYNYTDLELIL